MASPVVSLTCAFRFSLRLQRSEMRQLNYNIAIAP